MSRKPRLDRVREVANSTARVISQTYQAADGQWYKFTFSDAPVIMWDPGQEFYFWVSPHPKMYGKPRAAGKGRASKAFERWTGEAASTERDFGLPAYPLERHGTAGRIIYKFDRDGHRYWHHDWDIEDVLYLGSNTRGPRVFAINGPALQFTGRGIVG